MKKTWDEIYQKFFFTSSSDEKKFMRLYKDKRMKTKIHKTLLSMGALEEDAKDIVETGFAKMIADIRRGRIKVKAKLKGVWMNECKNLWLNERTRKKRIKLSGNLNALTVTEETPESIYISTEKQQIHAQILYELDNVCIHLLKARFLKTSYKDITRSMGFGSESAARARHSKCRIKLMKKALEPKWKNLLKYA